MQGFLDIDDYILPFFRPNQNEIGFRIGVPILAHEIGKIPGHMIKDSPYEKIELHGIRFERMDEQGICISASLRQNRFVDPGPMASGETNVDFIAILRLSISANHHIEYRDPLIAVQRVSNSGWDLVAIEEHCTGAMTYLLSGGRGSFTFISALLALGTIIYDYAAFLSSCTTEIGPELTLKAQTKNAFAGALSRLLTNWPDIYVDRLAFDSKGIWFIIKYPRIRNAVVYALAIQHKLLPPISFRSRFQTVSDYAAGHSFGAGFPDFQPPEYDTAKGLVYGIYLFKPGMTGFDDVPRKDLNVPQNVTERFQRTHDYARKKGYVGAFSSFHEKDHHDGRGVCYGTIFLKEGAAVWQNVPRNKLQDHETIEERFEAVDVYAKKMGYATGFPNLHEGDYHDGEGVRYGVILIRKTAVEYRKDSMQWRQAIVGELSDNNQQQQQPQQTGDKKTKAKM